MSFTISPTRLLTIGAILLLLVLGVGGAVAERLEQRASADRLHFGALSFDATRVAAQQA
jgi:hypothetical protein